MANSRECLEPVRHTDGGAALLEELDALVKEFMDITYGSERLLDRLDLLLHTLLELAADPDRGFETPQRAGPDPAELERRFLERVGPARREEAAEMLRIGRVSWRLRDDDNLLLSRVESQLFRAVDLALDRLRVAGRVHGEPRRTEGLISAIVTALSDPSGVPLELPAAEEAVSEARHTSREKPRQLVGQPAAPGLATGKVCRVVAADDIRRFGAGEVLVCDAIQPMMTHLVPLAAGIVERRGGMLIHGAIIAREMQIPCVNGIAQAVDLLEDGQIATVDGHLGIVTVGLPEFDLELR
jgi:pyruvate,water dikinase